MPPVSRDKNNPPEKRNPTAAPERKSTEDMPDWLKRVADSSLDQSGSQPAGTDAPLAPMPDWLRELGASNQSPSPAGQAEPDNTLGIPDWLVTSGAPGPAPEIPSVDEAAEEGAFAGRSAAGFSDEESFETEQEEESEASSGADETAEIEIPDWIKAMRPVEDRQPEKSEPGLQSPEGEASEIPDWVRRMAPPSSGQATPPLEPTGEPGAGETSEIPDWLQALKPSALESSAGPSAEPADADWKAALRAENQGGMDLARQQNAEFMAEAEASKRAAEAEGEQAAEAGVGESEGSADEGAAMPDWVRALRPPSAAADSPSAAQAMDESEREELPDWLREPLPATPGWPDLGRVQPAPEGEPGLVPAWMAELNPSSEGHPLGASTLEEVTETSGPLSGVRGVLPVALAVTQPHAISAGSAMPGSGAQIFKSILAGTQPPVVAAEKRGRGAVNRLIYLLVLIAALIPFALGGDNVGLGVITTFNTPALDPTKNFFDQLQALQPGATVLVAFDYEPGQSVEMDPIARAIVNDLARRNANIIAVSTSLTGARIAQNILNGAAVENPNWVSGINYINIGLLPGDEKGRRALAGNWLSSSQLDFGGKPISRSVLGARVKGWQDVALAVDLAATDDALRLWMEQVQPNVKTPFAAGVSAGLETLAGYYARPKQLVGFLHGLAGAAEYELMIKQPAMPAHLADAQSFVQLVILGVIVFANVGAFLDFLKKRRAAPSA